MPDEKDVVEITAPIELAVVDDRVHFTCISGKNRRTYSISFHKSRGAAMEAVALLNAREMERAASVRQLPKRGV